MAVAGLFLTQGNGLPGLVHLRELRAFWKISVGCYTQRRNLQTGWVDKALCHFIPRVELVELRPY